MAPRSVAPLLCLFLMGCSAPSDPVGLSLTAADSSLATVLVALHEADVDAFLSKESDTFVPDHTRRDSVLQHYGLDEASFGHLMQLKSADPERFVAIYNRALDIASGRK